MDFYKEEVEISSTNIDLNLECKLSELFLYFQDLAGKHSDILGSGRKNTTEKGLIWVITRFDVEITRMPRYGEKVTFTTYPGDSNPVFYYRHFYIEDEKGNVIIKANSLWTILNKETHQLVKDAFGDKKLPKVHLDNELSAPQKIQIEEGEYSYSKTIRYSDIDLNAHLNNTRYIELIQDAFDLSFYKEKSLKKFSINYMQEFKALDKVDIYVTKDNPYVITGKKDDKIHFISRIEFTNR